MTDYTAGAGYAPGAFLVHGDLESAMTVQEIIMENVNLRKLTADQFETLYRIGRALGFPGYDDGTLSEEEKEAARSGKLSEKVAALRESNLKWQRWYDEMADLAGSLEEQRDMWQSATRRWQKEYEVALSEVRLVEAKLEASRKRGSEMEAEVMRAREQRDEWHRKYNGAALAQIDALRDKEEAEKAATARLVERDRLQSQINVLRAALIGNMNLLSAFVNPATDEIARAVLEHGNFALR